MLVVLGFLFGRILVHCGCLETIFNEKGEHVTFDDSSTFSHDFQGPKGKDNCKVAENLTS